jgi:ADP-ribose pyrophosphatase
MTKTQQWETLQRRELFNAPPWMRLAVEDVRLPSGRVLRDFYSIELPEFAVIVAQTASGDIVTEYQYKHGVGRMSLTLPAGLLDDGEDPLACAQRELLEETGYVADEWHSLGQFVVDGNRGCGRAHVFVACDARQVAQPVLDEAEPLQVRLMSPAALLQAVLNGEVVVLATVAAAMLALNTPFVKRNNKQE